MNKFLLDYNSLESAVNKPRVYKYEDVKHKLVKVAYDIVKFDGPEEDIDSLWQVQATDDGEVIVAMYDESVKTGNDSPTIKSQSSWNVVADSKHENMFIFYKDHPIKKIATNTVGILPNDISSFCSNISNKLNSDKGFRSSLLNDLSNVERIELFSKHPEITQ